MVLKLISVAVVAAVFGAASAQAQSVARVGGPANLPPAGYQGQQWVDSRGCVFLKAGYGGQVKLAELLPGNSTTATVARMKG